MRLLFAWLALTLTASAQDRGMPPGWVLFVVQSQSCAPCMKFKNDYHTQPQFRHALESSFSVKACNWERLSERAWAQRRGVQALPSFLVYRDGVLQQTLTGYDGNWRGFLEKLSVDVGGAGGTSDGIPAPARPITPEERELPRISALESEVLRLQKLIADAARRPPESGSGLVDQAALRSEIDTLRRLIADAAKKPQPGASPVEKPVETDPFGGTGTPAASPPSPLIAAAQPSPGGGAGGGILSAIGGDWARVGVAAVSLLAPQFAIPAGAVGAAVTALQWLRKRRQVVPPTGTKDDPIIVPLAQKPTVRTETKYVIQETDIIGESYKDALRRVANANDQNADVMDALRQVESAAAQLIHGQRVVRRPKKDADTAEAQ